MHILDYGKRVAVRVFGAYQFRFIAMRRTNTRNCCVAWFPVGYRYANGFRIIFSHVRLAHLEMGEKRMPWIRIQYEKNHPHECVQLAADDDGKNDDRVDESYHFLYIISAAVLCTRGIYFEQPTTRIPGPEELAPHSNAHTNTIIDGHAMMGRSAKCRVARFGWSRGQHSEIHKHGAT